MNRIWACKHSGIGDVIILQIFHRSYFIATMPRSHRSGLSCAISLALISPIALAQTAPVPDDPRHDDAVRTFDTLEVRATPLGDSAEDLTRPVEVLAGERLDEAKNQTLGDSLSRLPGIQSSFFGPGVGRPIIRGFDGARVQVLSDGLGAGDVSTVSVDHAVSIEPFLADQIEVLKGPATLLYGSGAIGGAVNVVDGRIPEAASDRPFQGGAELRAGTVNDERTGMARLDGTSASGRWVFHGDILHRETGDVRIPGYAESAALLAEEGETPDPDTRGRLPNSVVRTDAGALGVSWVGERGFIGIGSSLFDTRYGVPGHMHEDDHDHDEDDDHDHDHDHAGHGKEGVQIVLDQRRHELRGGLDDLGAFRSLRVKLARTDYTHTEFEDGAVGTVFDNASQEGRLELVHMPWGGWEGAFGLQLARREFAAAGDEAFVPGTDTRDAGLFWMGKGTFGAFDIELGARHDRNRIALRDADDDHDAARRTFSLTSLSAAGRWNANDALHVSLNLDRAQRAPTAEELYSDGLHVATQSLELGDAGLQRETADRIELGAHWHRGPLTVGASLYHVRYADFIYLASTDLEVHHSPVRLWRQGDARFTGGELTLDWDIADTTHGLWSLHAFGDVVRARLDGAVGTEAVRVHIDHGDHAHDQIANVATGGNLPRIAPARLGAQLRWRGQQWRAAIGAVRYASQDRVAADESTTPGYTLVDAHLAWHLDTAGGNAWEVFLDGSNLLDREARAHTSFLKDLAPLPGRGVAFGVRLFF